MNAISSHRKTIHLLMPMSGQGTRYRKAGYTQPKPLIPVSGIPMVERLLAVLPTHWPSHFVMAENHRGTGLPEHLQALRPQGRLSYVEPHTLGPSFAVLKGLEGIPDDAPVLVTYCDYGMVWDPIAFERFVLESECDACLISYRGFHAHYLSPVKYAYSRMEGERVVEVREKGPFTDNRENEFASAGGYYFRSAKLLREAIEYQQKIGLSLNGEFYTSLTTEALLRMKPDAHVRVFEIPGFFQWGTPEDLQIFEFWEKAYRSANRFAGASVEVDQVLMPMAGLGSRFNALTPLKKPCVPVDGVPMFMQALKSMPRAKKAVFVALSSFVEDIRPHFTPECEAVVLEETPPGQALSTEAGVGRLDPEKEVIVTSCDHGIVLDPSLWNAFRAAPDCDAAIFTMRGFPGATRRPQAYAYVREAAGGARFPAVEGVSVKKPISDQPSRDPVLVGTFWFRSAELLQKGITELKKRDVRVNGELYLDSVFDVLAEMGHRVRAIPLDGYLCWGDPDSLKETLYWKEIFMGHRIAPREPFPGVPLK